MSYKFYNANPKGLLIDDCVLRSISVAEGISWGECQEKLSHLANKEGRLLNEVIFVEDYLDKKYNIAVRGGLHCAPLTHKFLNTEKQGIVRISLSFKNTKKEIRTLIKAIKNFETIKKLT